MRDSKLRTFAADILFESSECKVESLREPERIKFQRFVNLVNGAPVGFKVVGHTDSTGSKRTNIRLSQCRASSIAKELLKQLPFAVRAEVIGFGSSRPVSDFRTAIGRSKGRRVELEAISYRSIFPTVDGPCISTCDKFDPVRAEEMLRELRASP